MTHKEYAESLRAIADFFEQHEEIELPHDAATFNYFSAHTKSEMATIARALGSCEKGVSDWAFKVRHRFGTITFEAVANREDICKRVVTGKKHIPSHVIPAQPETFVPAKVEDVVEWQCEPLLEEAHAVTAI